MKQSYYTFLFTVYVSLFALPGVLHAALIDAIDQTPKNAAAQEATDRQFSLEETALPFELEAIQKNTAAKSALDHIDRRKQNNQEEAPQDDGEKIELQLEDTDLENFVKQIELLFDVTFIPDDIVIPMLSGKRAVKGNKITFRSNTPMTKSEVWSFFMTALDLAGLAIVPMGKPKFFRITKTEDARKSTIPAYIGTSPEMLPNDDQMIRYVYFVQEGSLATIKSVVESLRSTASAFLLLNDLNAFVLTDKAYNIKTLMQIITEFDRISVPETMSVLKLRQADASDVKALYDSIIQTDSKNVVSKLFPARKQPTTLYFPENIRMIADTRLNTLIILGPLDSVKKVEDFIRENIDRELDKPYSPLRTHALKFADATTVANIMNQLVQFGNTTAVGRSGGVRGSDKYLRAMTFTPEPSTNQLIIRGSEEDYLMVKDIIDQLDEQQPQVAIEVLIFSINTIDKKALGTQLRSKDRDLGTQQKSFGTDGFLGNNVKFQTSGITLGASNSPQGIQLNPNGTGITRLLANLIGLATGSTAGNTIITLGNDVFGVWGIFHALQTIANTQIISNPFLVATNKKQATVSVGETRRVVSGQTVSGENITNSFTNKDALLKLTVTPQINSDGMIILDLTVSLDVFTDPTNPTSATTTTKEIKTVTIVADNEVLALGGLIQNKNTDSGNKYPILSSIPFFGWLFKNYSKEQNKDDLLILISSRIIRPEVEEDTLQFTQRRVQTYQEDFDQMADIAAQRDPIHRFFLSEKEDSAAKIVENFIFSRKTKIRTRREKLVRKKERKKKKQEEIAAKETSQPPVKLAQKEAKLDLSTPLLHACVDQKEVKIHKKPSLTQYFSGSDKGKTA